MRGRVRGRQGYGDDEVGSNEAKEDERALPVWALLCDPAVHGQRSKEGQEHYEQGGNRRERPCGKSGDAGLVAQGGEVIYAGQARHLPPGLLALLALPFVGTSFGLFDSVFKEPV